MERPLRSHRTGTSTRTAFPISISYCYSYWTVKVLIVLTLLFGNSSIQAFSIASQQQQQQQPVTNSGVNVNNDDTYNANVDNDNSDDDRLLQSNDTKLSRPIVYTIAGSDCGGGAGIQADLHTIQNFNCHGCSIITCLTAQNSIGVTAVHTPPTSFLQEQMDVLLSDLPPTSIKIGMIGSIEIAQTINQFIQTIRLIEKSTKTKIWIVLDPVMISTSGYRLISNDTQQYMIDNIFPYVDILTPNMYEAEAILNRTFTSIQDIEIGAQDILQLGVPAVLMKGGHTISTGSTSSGDDNLEEEYAKDYFLSSSEEYWKEDSKFEPRICDTSNGCWIQSKRYNTQNTHGTGCTLSSSIASALALGEHSRRQIVQQQQQTTSSLNDDNNSTNYYSYSSSIDLVSACCLGKAYVTAGIDCSVQLGQGPGPVQHTAFPITTKQHYPIIVPPSSVMTSSSSNTNVGRQHFPRMKSFVQQQQQQQQQQQTINDDNGNNNNIPVLGSILPIVDSIEWIERLCETEEVTDLQLRIKNIQSMKDVKEQIQLAQSICSKYNVRLWINDYWDIALQCQCYGVHVGQEDLYRCINNGGIEQLKNANVALGISTHSFSELSVALGIQPTYISLGPIYPTTSKNVNFFPQGLNTIQLWRKLIPSHIPLITIGGINTIPKVQSVISSGADCVAVIGAITQQSNTKHALTELIDATTKAKAKARTTPV